MAKTSKKTQAKSDVVPNPTEPSTVTVEQTAWYPSGEKTYVVTRDGVRVSDKSYSSKTDESALTEMGFWSSVVRRYPDGSKIEIVEFDKKKHRIW